MTGRKESRGLSVVSPQPSAHRPATAGLTDAEVDALPAAMDFASACRALGIGTSLGYDLHHRGTFPVPVLRLGKRTLRVMKADVLAVLRGQSRTA